MICVFRMGLQNGLIILFNSALFFCPLRFVIAYVIKKSQIPIARYDLYQNEFYFIFVAQSLLFTMLNICFENSCNIHTLKTDGCKSRFREKDADPMLIPLLFAQSNYFFCRHLNHGNIEWLMLISCSWLCTSKLR